MNFHRTKRHACLDLPDRIAFEKCARSRIFIKRALAARIGPCAQADPSLPDLLRRKRCFQFFNIRAQRPELCDRALAGLQNARLHRIGTAPIAKPAKAHTLDITAHLRTARGLRKAMGMARVQSRLHVQKQRHIFGGARHRPSHGKLVAEHIARHIQRHEAICGAQPVDVVPRARVAQAAHHVRAIRDRHHPCRKRCRRAARRSPRRAAWIIGIARQPVHGIERVTAKAEFRRVGLADHNRACGSYPRNHQIVFRRNIARKNRRPHRG